MRTNIDIDDRVLEAAMQAGPFKTKKEAVDAGLKLLARQAAYREILKWEGKLAWDGEPWSDRDERAGTPADAASGGRAGKPVLSTGGRASAVSAQEAKPVKRSHGRR